MFIWNKVAIEKARILTEAGYSSSEVAAVLGTTRGSCTSRANRHKEFKFIAKAGQRHLSHEELAERLDEARAMVEHINNNSLNSSGILGWNEPPKSARKRVPKANVPAMEPKPGVVPDKTLSKEEFDALIKPHEVTEGSIRLMDAKTRSCRWILGEVSGLDTMICGKKTFGVGESYCDHHEKIARKPSKQKPLSEKAIQSLDRNIKQEDATSKESSSRQRRSSGVTMTFWSSRSQDTSKT